MTGTELGVLVAVGPEGLADGALEIACAEAVRRRVPVTLVHVMHTLVAVPPLSPDRVQALGTALISVAHEVLTSASERARELVGDQVPVVPLQHEGPVARTLVDLGREAEVIVVQRRDGRRLERMLTNSVSSNIAANAEGAVLVVPTSWSELEGAGLPITVGVDIPLEARELVRPGLAAAQATGRPLVVLHAAWISEPYESTVFADYPRDQWLRDAEAELRAGMASLLEEAEAAGVEVTLDVRWKRPVDALVRAADRSALLVLHRRTAGAWGIHLGAVNRGVLRHSECPVLIVDRE